MNTANLIERVAAEHGVAKEHAKRILDSAFAAIVAAVENGEDVALSGFGRFKLSNRAARQGRNPATGETIEIPLPGLSSLRPPRPSATPSMVANQKIRQFRSPPLPHNRPTRRSRHRPQHQGPLPKTKSNSVPF